MSARSFLEAARPLSTSVRSLREFIHKGGEVAKPELEAKIEKDLDRTPGLKDKVKKVVLQGDERKSTTTGKWVASGVLYSESGSRVSSGHFSLEDPPEYSRGKFRYDPEAVSAEQEKKDGAGKEDESTAKGGESGERK